jgi:hypothetical protein
MVQKLIIITILLMATNMVFGQESLKIVWLEKYEWKLLSNQDDGAIHIIEIVPGEEKGKDWTMLGQMLSIKGAVNIPMETAQNMMLEQSKVKFPNAKLTFLEKDEADEFPWILFKIENPNASSEKKPESQLWYIRQGKTALFVNFIAVKEKELKADFVAEWSPVFKASEVVNLIDGKEENKND